MRLYLWVFAGLFFVPTMLGTMVRWFLNGMTGDFAPRDLMFATVALALALILDWIASRKTNSKDS